MPIRPENKSLYPSNWKEIVRRIKERAGYKCELCGAVNYSNHPITGSFVVLTIMHLDHNPQNVSDDNLTAACQKCHNSYDAPMRVAGIKKRKMEKLHKNQGILL